MAEVRSASKEFERIKREEPERLRDTQDREIEQAPGGEPVTTPTPEPTPPPEVIKATSGKEFIVKTPEGIKRAMTQEEIEAAGGTVPTELERESTLHQIGVEQGIQAREAQAEEYRIADAAQRLYEQQGLSSYDAALETIRRFEQNPTSPEFIEASQDVIEALSETAKLSPGQKGQLQEARQAYQLKQAQQFREENVPVGRMLPQPEYISKETWEQINRDYPVGAEILRTRGVAAYNEWLNQASVLLQERNEAAIARYEKYMEGMRLKEEELKDFISEQPIGLQIAFEQGGIEGYNKAVEEYNQQIEQQRKQFEAELKTMPQELQDAYARGGIREYNDAVEAYNLILEQKQQIEQPKSTGNELLDLTAKILEERPHLEGWQAYDLAKFELKRQGKEIIEPKATPEQVKQAIKNTGIDLVGRIVPGVYTAVDWGTLSTKDKAIAIGIDLASVAAMVLGIKAAGGIAKRLAGVSKVQKLATQAGKAGKELKEVTKVYEQTTNIKLPKSIRVRQANNVEVARAKAVKADKQFLDALSNIKGISKSDLTQLEKKSGLQGIKSAVLDVNNSINKLEKAWKNVDKTKFNANARTPAEIKANNARLKALDRLQKAQSELELSLNKAGSILKPLLLLLSLPVNY